MGVARGGLGGSVEPPDKKILSTSMCYAHS